MSLRSRLDDALDRLHDLNLGEPLQALRRNRHIRTARRDTRRELKHKRNRLLDRIDAAIKAGANPEADRIKAWEREVRAADARIGELHSVITRAIERIAELAPKVTRRQKRKRRILAAIRKLRKEIRNQHPPEDADHFAPLDGKVGPEWIVKIALDARAAGYWHGVAISLFRTVAYSISLCEAICGAPSCPGTCAGALTNHVCPPSHTGVPYEGAGDFSDPAGLDRFCQAHDLPLIGNGRVLPRDPNHFSNRGN